MADRTHPQGTRYEKPLTLGDNAETDRIVAAHRRSGQRNPGAPSLANGQNQLLPVSIGSISTIYPAKFHLDRFLLGWAHDPPLDPLQPRKPKHMQPCSSYWQKPWDLQNLFASWF